MNVTGPIRCSLNRPSVNRAPPAMDDDFEVYSPVSPLFHPTYTSLRRDSRVMLRLSKDSCLSYLQRTIMPKTTAYVQLAYCLIPATY